MITKNKILGVRNYQSDKQEFVVSDFVNLEILVNILDEIDTGESDISPAGKRFLEKYYGLKKLASLLIKQGMLAESIKVYSFEKLWKWLENLEPMNTRAFMKESRGNISNVQTLKDKLLPPEAS